MPSTVVRPVRKAPLLAIFALLKVFAQATSTEDAVLVNSGRELQQSSTSQNKCTWISGACYVNDNFALSLTGTPTTDTGKLLANVAARNYACTSLTSESACKASATCVWFGSSNTCVLAYAATTSNARGKLYCSGSLIDTAVTCATLPSASCGGDCVAGDSAAAGSFLSATSTDDSAVEDSTTSLALALGATYTGDAGTDTCKAKWLTNTTQVKSLATANSINFTTTDGGLFRLVAPLFVSDFIGSCSAATKAAAAAKACTAATNRTACVAAATCYWAADPASNATETAGKCDLSVHAYITMGTIDKTNDPWGAAYAAAYTSCAALTTESACNASATVQLNTSLATSWLTLTPSETIAPTPAGSPGGGSASAVAMSLPVLLLSVLVSLLVFRF